MPAPTITFFGNFGTQNLGNEYTLKAILENLRKRLPGARFACVCPDPRDAAARYGIAGVPMTAPRTRSSTRAAAHGSRLAGLFRKVFLRAPLEIVEWWRAYRALRGTRLLVMTGTGMLGDFGIGPFDLHYQILKWSAVAKLRGAKVLFVSVGAGPIADPRSRWIVKRAVSLADYRSYRDAFSKDYLARIGFDTRRDAVYPDLAFSLDPFDRAARRDGDARVVGVGLMDYYGSRSSPERGEAVYRRYVENMAAFVDWLLGCGYAVRLLIGDVAYDTRVRRDVKRLLRRRNAPGEGGCIADEPISSIEDLVTQLAHTDVVVATRFHNLLLALMLDKPVLALSYHEKIASLLAGMGLGEYCHDVDRFDLGKLVEQFIRLEQGSAAARLTIRRKRDEYRRALDEQYALISSLSGAA
jgi:polysaccharide pyruvyl transferase WcaK-like protein